MKKEDFIKAKEELKSKISKNNKQIYINDERKRMAMANRFEDKAGETIVFSILPYLGFFGLSCQLIKNEMFLSFLETIHADSFPLLLIGSSIGAGTIGRKILEWKFKIKERLHAFTTAHTQADLIQEEVKYTIELEKIKNRNLAIEQSINLLNLNQDALNSLAERYDIKDKTIPQTEEEAKENAKKLSILLENKYQELDLLTTQKILHEKFLNKQNILKDIMISLYVGILTLFLYILPFFIITNYITSPNVFIPLWAPLFIGIAAPGGYMIKKIKDYKKAYYKLKSELNSVFPDQLKMLEKQENIDSKIENTIKEISSSEIQLQEQKRIIESFPHVYNEEKDYTNGKTKPMIPFENFTTSLDNKNPQLEEKGRSLCLKRNN